MVAEQVNLVGGTKRSSKPKKMMWIGKASESILFGWECLYVSVQKKLIVLMLLMFDNNNVQSKRCIIK